jgi:hypothetical protein
MISGASAIKRFTAVIVVLTHKARVLSIVVHFHPNLIFAGKARRIPPQANPIRDTTLIGSSLACNYLTRLEVNGSDKHCSS